MCHDKKGKKTPLSIYDETRICLFAVPMVVLLTLNGC